MTITDRTRVGELRPSQMLYTYGVGSIIELPNISAMVMGLDDWAQLRCAEVVEDRLLLAVRVALGPQVAKMIAPPMPPESSQSNSFLNDEDSRIGVPVAPFPRWLRCPACQLLAPVASSLFDFKCDPYRMDRARFVHSNCQRLEKPTVVPARFLVACQQGHLDDFPWVDFVHRGGDCARPLLRMVEYGVSGEAADIEISCSDCGAKRRMSDAFGEGAVSSMPTCRGRRPHLRDFEEEGCGLATRTIGLGASNMWFGTTRNALSIPVEGDGLIQRVDEHWGLLKNVQDPSGLKLLRTIGQLPSFTDVDDTKLFEGIQQRHAGVVPNVDASDLKGPEWRVLIDPDNAKKTKDFVLRNVAFPKGFDALNRVVLAERLREVTALIGFTRLESSNEYGTGAEVLGPGRASITRQSATIVPAGEVRGEGIFLSFSEARIHEWSQENLELLTEFMAAHRAWREQRNIESPEDGFPGMRYVLIHTFSHALMRQLSLECGYSAASIRERIYAREPEEEGGPMAGVLLYTAAPDSEGTLGGLVRLGEPENLGRHIQQALEQMRLCTSDPLCAEHHPDPEGATLHGAACHACLFAPETSCERGNQYLDRSVLIETVDPRVKAFFGS